MGKREEKGLKDWIQPQWETIQSQCADSLSVKEWTPCRFCSTCSDKKETKKRQVSEIQQPAEPAPHPIVVVSISTNELDLLVMKTLRGQQNICFVPYNQKLRIAIREDQLACMKNKQFPNKSIYRYMAH